MRESTTRRLAIAALVVLAAVAVYGFLHEHLFSQSLWTPQGGTRFLGYSVGYWFVASVLIWIWPRGLGLVIAGCALAWTIWWAGLAAPLAVLYLLGSCHCLGRLVSRGDVWISTLVGATIWILLIWIALHFRINYRLTYAIALAIPNVLVAQARRPWPNFQLPRLSRIDAGGLAVLLFFLAAHFLAALKPETSSDGLSMHLVLPMAVAHQATWSFDFHHYFWALIPAGGECIYTAAYLLGGETAAHLSNFAFLGITCGLIASFLRRWLSPAQSFLAAALFASTPMVLLLTGSLFVENLWTAMVAGAAFSLWRYVDTKEPAYLRVAAILLGGALSVKVLAAMFVPLSAAAALWVGLRAKHYRALTSAAILFALFAAPPYLYAQLKSKNPVFPFANGVFRSPYLEPSRSFSDPRFESPLNLASPYEATFRSRKFMEGQGGAAGFQYFCLLLPAALLTRRRSTLMLLAFTAIPTLGLFAFLPNLRYMYPALALFSVAIGAMLAEARWAWLTFLPILALNTWFLPSAGWYDRDFALFRKADVAPYLENGAPERKLISHLNRTAHGEPVAFFSSDAVAGLDGLSYVESWHSEDYWNRVRTAMQTAGIAAVMHELGIRHLLAPLNQVETTPVIESFLREWAAPTGVTSGRVALFELRSEPLLDRPPPPPLLPGTYDDLDNRIEYTGAWFHDRQFLEPIAGSVTYSSVPGNSLRLRFTGSAIAYIFTKAINRGTALVIIDGAERARVPMYSEDPSWRSQASFTGLPPGTHSFEVRVLDQKDPRASDYFVDLDAVVVTP